MSTTQAELTGALRRAQWAAEAAGVDVSAWALHGGSAANGIQYKLATGTGVVNLGLTKTDAWRTLSVMATAFEMVR